MLKEVRDDNKDNDAEHMKPVSIGSHNKAGYALIKASESMRHKTCRSFGHVFLTASALLISPAMLLQHAVVYVSVAGHDQEP